MNNGFNVNNQELDTYLVPRSYFNMGTGWGWGAGQYGNLGDNTTIMRSSPVQTISGGLNWKQIVTQKSFSTGIKTDGSLWTWGSGSTYGVLGNSTTGVVSSPVQTTAGGTNWRQVSAGTNQSQSGAGGGGGVGAVKSDGSLWTWGYNNYGGLGDQTTVSKSSPIQTVAGGLNWNQVSATSMGHMAAVKVDGSLWNWGYNNRGQLGNEATFGTANQTSPIQTVSGGRNWKSVAVGGYYTMAIKTDGTLWGWGYNYQGQLGDNTTTSYGSPVQTIAGGNNWKQVSASTGAYGGGSSPATTAAIKTDGTLWMWGTGSGGQLGNNTVNTYSSPVQTIAAGTNWQQVSAGYNFTMAIKTDGTLWTWGQNTSTIYVSSSTGAGGQLGDNTSVAKSSPVQTIAGGYNWTWCSAGYCTSVAVNFINTFPS